MEIYKNIDILLNNDINILNNDIFNILNDLNINFNNYNININDIILYICNIKIINIARRKDNIKIGSVIMCNDKNDKEVVKYLNIEKLIKFTTLSKFDDKCTKYFPHNINYLSDADINNFNNNNNLLSLFIKESNSQIITISLRDENLTNIIKYCIYAKKFQDLIDIIYFTTNKNIFIKLLYLFPDFILCKVLNTFIFDSYTISFYYIRYKISNDKYIPFELFPINNNKLIYACMLLLNNKYYVFDLNEDILVNEKFKIMHKIDNGFEKYKNIKMKLLKFNNIFNRLHYDLKLKICGINNFDYTDLRLCSMYLL